MMLIVVVSMFVVCELPDVGLRLAVTIYEFTTTVRLDLDAVRYSHVCARYLRARALRALLARRSQRAARRQRFRQLHRLLSGRSPVSTSSGTSTVRFFQSPSVFPSFSK